MYAQRLSYCRDSSRYELTVRSVIVVNVNLNVTLNTTSVLANER